jgi:hypothetical protein
MNEENDTGTQPPAEDEGRARDRVEGLSSPVPDPAFADRLRAEFIRGAIQSPIGLSGGRGRRSWLSAGMRVAAAVIGVVLLLTLVLRLNRGPDWVVAGTSGTGALLVDGKEIPATELGRHLAKGRRLETRGELQLDLLLPRTLLLQMPPGAIIGLPTSPGRWFGRSVEGDIWGGEVRYATGPLFDHARLTIHGPQATILVTGTTIAVICEPDATCLCVFDGEAVMTAPDGTSERVPAGIRRTVFASGSPPRVELIQPMERMKLGMLSDQADSLLGNGR